MVDMHESKIFKLENLENTCEDLIQQLIHKSENLDKSKLEIRSHAEENLKIWNKVA